VTAVNDALTDDPEKINDDPYGGGWLVKVRLSDPSETSSLMDAAAYEATLN
jgi:glycine cleavage system H protein